MNNKSTWIGIAALVLAIAGGVWAFNQRENPDVVAARAVNKKMVAAFSDENVSMDDKMKLREEAQAANEKLSEEDRSQVQRDAWKSRGRQMESMIDDYLAIEDEDERNAYLDEQIEKFQGMRDQWKQMREKREAEAKERGEEPKEKKEGGRRGGGWYATKPGDKQGMMDRQRRSLDKSSPEQRAKFTEFFTALKERMEERGIESGWGK